MRLLTPLLLTLVPAIIAAGCNSLKAMPDNTTPTTLKDNYQGRFLMGACIGTRELSTDERVQGPTMQLVAEQFNAVTPENCMKWELIHPEPQRYDFDAPDRLVAFAQANGHIVFGHTLIWHNQTPDWVFEDDAGNEVSRDILIERMREHINTVVGRYKGKIHAWDVVNEPVRNGADSGGDLMRPSRWRDIIGDDYLAMAYRMAHEADPDAVLIFNDYQMVGDAKRGRYIALVKQLLAEGVPVHAVGIQGHWGPKHPDEKTLRQILEEISALGLPMHITELDDNLLYGFSDDEDPYANGLPDDVARHQAKMYATWFKLFDEFADKIDRVSFWGVHDGASFLNSWPDHVRRKNHPLLFDRELQPKLAFEAAMNPEAYLKSITTKEGE